MHETQYQQDFWNQEAPAARFSHPIDDEYDVARTNQLGSLLGVDDGEVALADVAATYDHEFDCRHVLSPPDRAE